MLRKMANSVGGVGWGVVHEKETLRRLGLFPERMWVVVASGGPEQGGGPADLTGALRQRRITHRGPPPQQSQSYTHRKDLSGHFLF